MPRSAETSAGEITAVRGAVDAGFSLCDGSSRRIRASVEAGASGVVATPLSVLPALFPERSLAALQPVVDKAKAELDCQPSRGARLALLAGLARAGWRDAPNRGGELA